ncbi:hypothetical protein GCM10023189_12500 [Nibrella saemangeumensis]|uniref:DUF2382 domain-containing protein n=1 Tax=Nibrella saemangeumensis TaxID=1084526 RepID=A0ABP8MJK2_9BACT
MTADHPHNLNTSGSEGTDQSRIIPVIEEQIHIGKDVVETGRVVISKRVREEEQTVDIPLVSEEMNVERVAVNQYVDTPPAVRYEGETMIIPVLKEVLVVEKRLVLVEELHVTKRQVETTETQRVTLRKEEVTVDRIPHNTTDQA